MRKTSLIILGLAAAGLLLVLGEPLPAAAAALAGLWLADRTPVIGDTPIPPEAAAGVDVRAVRQYREQHPGVTITEAVAATTRR
ncbi:hypothetical protein J2Y89_001752 [Curtobacterium herbarum]|uniref:hypothetical protein n=1 Tax=Curtobacterium TaxID=2034 RepID=UPI000DA7345D|nr:MULTISPECIES: hypothetical protein [Curtobacterium]MCP1503008.1 hypothetical protein [Curtobacterium herbarum]WIE60897.1 hypothetical protein DEI97_014230 [Curtobacterium sp. MCLR17_032]